MKTRNGFVSNSSSSSFIVFFPKEPKSAEDVKNILFNEDQTVYGCYDDLYSVDQVAETVWNDICSQKINNFEEALEELSSGGAYDAPSYSDFEHIKDWREKSDAYDNALNIYANKKMKELFNIRKQKLKKINNEPIDDVLFYIFSYSDNDGSYGSALEHGSLFNKLKNIRISHH